MTLAETVPAPFDLAQTDLLLTTTRSVRRRLDVTRPVPPRLIAEAIDIAVQAPTAENEQNWRWLVLTDPQSRRVVSDAVKTAWRFHATDTSGRSSRRRRTAVGRRTAASVSALAELIDEVPVLIVPCLIGPPPDVAALDRAWLDSVAHKPSDDSAHRVQLGAARQSRYYGSIYPAVWSLQLALRSRGLGTTINCLHLPFASMVGEQLGIPRAITQICMLPVAYTRGTQFRPAERKPGATVTYWERWGAGPAHHCFEEKFEEKEVSP
jgi:nitroreductase